LLLFVGVVNVVVASFTTLYNSFCFIFVPLNYFPFFLFLMFFFSHLPVSGGLAQIGITGGTTVAGGMIGGVGGKIAGEAIEVGVGRKGMRAHSMSVH
jgi:hypothetical protein